MNADESCHGGTEVIHPFGGLANTGSALNIRVHLHLTVFSRIIRHPQRRDLEATKQNEGHGNQAECVRRMCSSARSRRLRVCSRPSSARVWSMGGDTARPAAASRSGWAVLQAFRPRAAA